MADIIQSAAQKLVSQCGSRDPFRIAKELGIEVEVKDIGSLKGMYTVIKRNRFIVISDRLDEPLRSIVCAHEIGHDQQHRKLAAQIQFREFSLFDIRSKPEYEANVFAAHLLLDEDEIMEMADREYSFDMLAGELGTEVNLLIIKLREMERQGYPVNIPYIPSGDFLGKI